MRLRLKWDDYKSDNDSRCVHFPGGFQLYALRRRQFRDGRWFVNRHWSVWWGDGYPETPEMTKLHLRKFSTRGAAQIAAERVFVPMALIAAELIAIPRAFRNVKASAVDAFVTEVKK